MSNQINSYFIIIKIVKKSDKHILNYVGNKILNDVMPLPIIFYGGQEVQLFYKSQLFSTNYHYFLQTTTFFYKMATFFYKSQLFFTKHNFFF